MAMMLGCSLSADHRFHRDIDAGGLRPVVDDQRNLGLVGHGAEVEHLRVGAVDQILVVMRGADHRRLVAHLGGAIGESTVSRTLSTPVPAISSFSGAAYLATCSQTVYFSSGMSITLSPVEPMTTYPESVVRFHFSTLCWILET